jgi:hypothetical protein
MRSFTSFPQVRALVTTTIYNYLKVEGGELYERLKSTGTSVRG